MNEIITLYETRRYKLKNRSNIIQSRVGLSQQENKRKL